MQSISLPFYISQHVKSLFFYIREAWKRYPFRVEPPRIGTYTPPPPSLDSDCFISCDSVYDYVAYKLSCEN